jgi:hypothetical protein
MDKLAEKIDINKVDDSIIECGTLGATIQTITFIVLILCLCSSGVFIFMQKSYDMETEATITEKPDCAYNTVTDNKGNVSRTTNCFLKIKYTVNNVDYNTTINVDDDRYKINEKIVINYKKEDPRLVSYNPLNYQFAGGIILAIACICILSLILHIYLTKKSDWYKRYQCASLFL